MTSIKNNYFSLLINLTLLFNLVIFFLSIFFVQYAVKEYILFSIISISYFYYSSLKFRYYTELYLSIFIYLGFYFKSTFTIIFSTVNKIELFPESAPFSGLITDEFLNKHLSELFNISSISIVTIFLIFYIFNNFIVYSHKKHNECKLESIKKLFSNNKLKLYFALLLITILFISLNFFFSIAVRGKKFQELDVLVSIFKTFLFFGFYFIVCIFLEFENSKKNINYIFFFNIMMGFLISISIYSRAMITDQLVIFFSAIHKIKKFFFKSVIFMFIIFFFILSVFIVNYMREIKWNLKPLKTNEQTFQTNEQTFQTNEQTFQTNEQKFQTNEKVSNKEYTSKIKEFTSLIVSRWVGIDGLSNIVNYKEKNLNFYLAALKEKKKSGITFYESNFFFKTKEAENYSSSHLPGFIAFSYYSGSILILIITLILLTITMIFLEKIINYLSMNSLIITNYLVFLIVWRIIHFGSYPINTVYYFLLIVFFVFCIFFFNKLLDKYYDK
jgi:hypothetical protein